MAGAGRCARTAEYRESLRPPAAAWTDGQPASTVLQGGRSRCPSPQGSPAARPPWIGPLSRTHSLAPSCSRPRASPLTCSAPPPVLPPALVPCSLPSPFTAPAPCCSAALTGSRGRRCAHGSGQPTFFTSTLRRLGTGVCRGAALDTIQCLAAPRPPLQTRHTPRL